MSTVRWIHPETLLDLRRALQDGARLHGGGTGILRNPPSSGLVADLSRLGIDACSTGDGVVRLGATARVGDAARHVAALDPEHLLVKAFGRMAAPALRNRITVGGSVALFPPWSSVVGPLLALDARVELVGSREQTVPLTDYLDDRELRAATAIVAVEFDAARGLRSYWFSYARTRLNYPLFSVAVLGRGGAGTIDEVRVVITGNVGRYRILNELAARLAGSAPPDRLSRDDLGTRIPDRQGFSGDYLTHVAAVEVARGLAHVAGGTR